MRTRVVFFVALFAAALFLPGCAPDGENPPLGTGQTEQTFEKEVKKKLRLDYLLYLPPQYNDSREKWPLVLFLHGAGERGPDVTKVTAHGPPKLVAKEGKTFPFILLSPQCPEDKGWTEELQLDALDALLNEIGSRYRVDADRIYVTGLSMGGFATWALAFRYPDRFAALAPICGRGNPTKVERIKHVPVWVFHGAKDKLVPPRASEEMVDALKKLGANVKFTLYPNADHDSWTETYNNPEFYEWLLQQRRGGR